MEAFYCAHCGSNNVVHRFIDLYCMGCGGLTSRDGVAVEREPEFAGGPTAYDRRPK